MSNDLVRTKLEQSLEVSSLTDLVRQETDYPMLLLDFSSSMNTDVGGYAKPKGRSRIAALKEVVNNILLDGPVTMIAFGGESSMPRFVDNVPERGENGTPMHLAIRLAKEHGATRCVIISDGAPDNKQETTDAARAFAGRIDVIFVGAAGEAGSLFLDELASMTGGQRFEMDLNDTKQLTGKITLLLTGDVEPERAPIQGEGFAVVEPDDEDEDDDEDDDEEEEDEDDDEDDDQ